MNDETPSQMFYRLYSPQTLVRYLGNVVLLVVLALVILGMAFMQFAFAIAVMILLLAGFWEPAYQAFLRLARLPVPSAPFQPLPAPRWFLVLLAAQTILMGGLLIFSGIWLLAERGFLAQNLIYSLFFST